MPITIRNACRMHVIRQARQAMRGEVQPYEQDIAQYAEKMQGSWRYPCCCVRPEKTNR